MRHGVLGWVSLVAVLVAGCGGKGQQQTAIPKVEGQRGFKGYAADADRPREDIPRPAPVASGQRVELRLNRGLRKPLMYEGSFERTQASENKATETGTFYITYFCANKVPEKNDRTLDLVAIRRTFLERTRVEELENKKKIDRIMPITDDLIDLGPNFKEEGGLRLYGIDAQHNVRQFFEDHVKTKDDSVLRGRITKDDGAKITIETATGAVQIDKERIENSERMLIPHVLLYDSPHYFFPLFPVRAVAPGETWAFEVLFIIPQSMNGSILPTQFPIRVTSKLRQLVGEGEQQTALIDYTAEGEFDSSQDPFKDRFSEAFHATNRIIHRVKNTGTLRLLIAPGILSEKQENLTVHLESVSETPQGDNQPKKVSRSQADITSLFRLRWLPPGTKLKSGDPVPPSE